jgi:hypothetical protein
VARKNKTVEQVVRESAFGKPARRARTKSAADVWYEQMLAEHKTNGAEHLASAKAKIK